MLSLPERLTHVETPPALKTLHAQMDALPSGTPVVIDGQPTTGAPVITGQPTAQTAPVGGNATFAVTATGNATLTYQWAKDDTDLPGETEATLSLTNVQVADAGSYAVVVTNTAGAVTSAAAELTVASATHAVFGHGYVAGGTVTLTVTAGAPDRAGSAPRPARAVSEPGSLKPSAMMQAPMIRAAWPAAASTPGRRPGYWRWPVW